MMDIKEILPPDKFAWVKLQNLVTNFTTTGIHYKNTKDLEGRYDKIKIREAKAAEKKEKKAEKSRKLKQKETEIMQGVGKFLKETEERDEDEEEEEEEEEEDDDISHVDEDEDEDDNGRQKNNNEEDEFYDVNDYPWLKHLDSSNGTPDPDALKNFNNTLKDEKSKFLSRCDKFMKGETIPDLDDNNKGDENEKIKASWPIFTKKNCKLIYDSSDNDELLKKINEMKQRVRATTFVLEGLSNVLQKLQDKGKQQEEINDIHHGQLLATLFPQLFSNVPLGDYEVNERDESLKDIPKSTSNFLDQFMIDRVRSISTSFDQDGTRKCNSLVRKIHHLEDCTFEALSECAYKSVSSLVKPSTKEKKTVLIGNTPGGSKTQHFNKLLKFLKKSAMNVVTQIIETIKWNDKTRGYSVIEVQDEYYKENKIEYCTRYHPEHENKNVYSYRKANVFIPEYFEEQAMKDEDDGLQVIDDFEKANTSSNYLKILNIAIDIVLKTDIEYSTDIIRECQRRI